MSRKVVGEEHLLRTVRTQDEQLYLSLLTIRTAVEQLWDFQPLVRDFTKHDLDHVTRVIRYLGQLLACNRGKDLTVEEAYALLAATYLHDIGMQCDVPAVQHICGLAIEKGPEGYTHSQQTVLREKHGELVSAWIEYAFKPEATETNLIRAIKTIPRGLVPVVIDIARHHTGADVMKCPEDFITNRGGRQRRLFLALLLRLADELDIGDERINIDTVIQFDLPPQNALYWWLHYVTTVLVDTQNKAIAFKVTLHPSDIQNLGEKILEKVVERFRHKNTDLVEELSRQGIHILISQRPIEVYSNPAYPHLPPPVIAQLDTPGVETPMTSPLLAPAERLANEVSAMLIASGYTIIQRRKEDQRTVSLLCQRESGLLRQKVQVDCVAGEASPEDIKRIASNLSHNGCSIGYIVSQVRVANLARNLAQERFPEIQVFSQGEFYRQLIDFKHYIDWLQQECTCSDVGRFYIPLACSKKYIDEQGRFQRDEYDSLEEYVFTWQLENQGRNHLSILGEFGSGKTWFCRHYACQQLQRYLKDPVRERFPILVPLRNYARSGSIRELITDLLANHYQMQWTGGYQLIDQLNRQGRLLFILDGFDEMARTTTEMDSRKAIVANFWKLADIVVPNSKVILTSRTEYFRYTEEANRVMGGEEYDSEFIDLSDPVCFEVIHLREFDETRVRNCLNKRLDEKHLLVEDYWSRIQKDENLSHLAKRPALLEIIVDILHEIPQDEVMNPAKLYRIWTNRWLDHQEAEERALMSKSDKLTFMSELAWKMVGDPAHPQLRIPYQEIPVLLQSHFGDRLWDEPFAISLDIDSRTRSFLTRDDHGYYEFAHKNLAEYFTAVKYALELGLIQPEYVAGIPDQELSRYSKVKTSHNQVQVDWNKLKATFGLSPLSREIRELLQYIIANTELLWKLLRATFGHDHEQIGYTGGNIATLLRLMGCSFRNAQLSGMIMKGADLCDTDFSGADLGGAVLREAMLERARFVSPDFPAPASLTEADLSSANLNLAVLDGVDLSGANCTEITVEEGREIRTCAFDPGGSRLAYGTWEGVVRLIDPDNFNQDARMLGKKGRHLNSVTCLAYVPGGHLLVSGSYDSRIKVWEVDLEKTITEFYEPNAHFRCLAINSTGRYLAVADKGGVLYLLQFSPDQQELTECWRERLPSGAIRCLGFHPIHPDKLIVGEYNGALSIFDISNATRQTRMIRTLQAHKKWIAGFSFIPDVYSIATVGWDGALNLWEFDTGKLIRTVYQSNQPLRGLAVDSTGQRIVIGENSGRVQIVDVQTGKAEMVEGGGHADTVYSLAFRPGHPDQFTSVGLDASVKLWDVETGNLIRQIEGKSERFHCRGMKIGGAIMTVDERDYFMTRGAVE